MEYTGFAIFPIPASIRRHLPYLYSSRSAPKGTELSGDPHRGLASSSEPNLPYQSQSSVAVDELDRPSTASDDLNFDSGSGRSYSPRENVCIPAKYETESGLRWNRVVPAFNLLRNAGYEAQQPQADVRLARSLYVNALVYLLDALPLDLTDEESSTIQRHIPEPVKMELTKCAQYPASSEALNSKKDPSPRSYLHKILALTIVQFFILLRFILPYAKLLVCRLHEYERTHRITERIVSTTLDAADGLGKGSARVGAAVHKFNDGPMGAALSNFAVWCMEGVAGGIYEGVGEGMMHLGVFRQNVDFDRLSLQPIGR